jgi:hypothetical protein
MPPILVASIIIIVVAMNTTMITTTIYRVKAVTKGAAFFERVCNTMVWQRGQRSDLS